MSFKQESEDCSIVQVFTAVGSEKDAERIANKLVENREAACVQISAPVSSIYWWEGKIERAKEWVCVVKTRSDLFEAVQSTICRNHPYKVPEIISIPITEGNEDYIAWINDELKK